MSMLVDKVIETQDKRMQSLTNEKQKRQTHAFFYKEYANKEYLRVVKKEGQREYTLD